MTTTGNVKKRLQCLEDAQLRVAFGLPRTPEESQALLAKLRQEKLRRIRENPRAYGIEVARVLARLEPDQRAVAIAAISAPPMEPDEALAYLGGDPV